MILRYPVNYIAVTQYFKQGVHNGLDLGWKADKNQPIYSAADGEVIAVVNNYETNDTTGSSYGNYVKIKHSDVISTLYAHMKLGSVLVKVGDKVKQGEQLGLMGNTGYSFGNHLHYEVFVNGIKTNPQDYTYVFEDQSISTNSTAIENLKYYKDTKPQNDEISELKKQNQELLDKNKMLNQELILLKEEIEENKKNSFIYEVNKTGKYKIMLYENETLIVRK